MHWTRADTTFLILALATLASWWLGESAGEPGGTLGTAGALAVLALAALKGAFIALDYMALRSAPALWRRLVLGWLAAVLTVIAVVTLGLAR